MVLESKYGSPKIVNDGVTVAKEVELEDPVENIGAKLVRQVSFGPTVIGAGSTCVAVRQTPADCWLWSDTSYELTACLHELCCSVLVC